MKFTNNDWRRYGIWVGAFCLLLWGCAQIKPLTGGDKDEDPPILDTLNSTANFQTNFKKQSLVFTFDEWLQLKDVNNQVVMSPPLPTGKKLEVYLRKKSVRVDFPEDVELRDSATYIINFGEAISDFNEGNPVPNFRFVFSTGDYIDSLEMRGKIVDAYTGEAVEDVFVMLYDNLADSVVRTEPPFYFYKTDKSGGFRIQNIRADTFKVFALKTTGFNYLFDQNDEQIAFADSFAIITDSTSTSFTMRLFQEQAPLRKIKIEDKEYGLIKINFNRKPFDIELDYKDVGQRLVQQVENDTLKIWYDMPSLPAWEIYLPQDTLVDTIQVSREKRSKFLEDAKLQIAGRPVKGEQKINPIKGIQLKLNNPLWSIDSSRISLLEDTLLSKVNPKVEIDSLDKRNIKVQYAWKGGIKYKLQLLPGALRDIYQLTHDTLEFDFVGQSFDDLGTLNLELKSQDQNQDLVLQLLKKDLLIHEDLLSRDSLYTLEYKSLELGSDYRIEVIEDRNGNGRWDTGNYDLKKQPERVFKKPLGELRANFIVVEEVNVIFKE